MKKIIRQLGLDDLHYLKEMETGIEDDYILRVYSRISSGSSRLYGLFVDDRLASIGGYTIFAKQYIMLGRMRSDLRFRGKNLSTQLMSYIMEQAFSLPAIQWIGANTQQENTSARRVMDKLGLAEVSTLYSAISIDASSLETGGAIWKSLTTLSQKQAWVDQLYIQTGAVFPYECYYTFPASEELFADAKLAQWSFFENPQKDRVLIAKKDYKRDYYLHIVYPWDDLMEQAGLWETVSLAQRELSETVKAKALLWIDLSPSQVSALPTHHMFNLPSPWLLYGVNR
ncbi:MULTISPECIES: GNAT family N-acetyltransferase [Planococcus]|uniref:GCN5 family acetyltransferase n=2 Tax=Planococcus TaxID=1372 RepID=A0ABN4K1B8_9BACL|nr:MULTISPECIES: GNAT family N-acetyltransferase [Planococcus]ALS79473.1 GCN5 family acetyltransferase [Planococcus kocurii]AQU78558.1 N-acetyltransferase [Planococcus faecalis]KAA0957013.1 GNAT family N-acetyltransferase [Planococcus sp. ANT_H30]MDJ0331478.1 GNAT family N-acetyltransferase [Planococcus sp. S3-L1]OHX53250.1 GCN5 family acetyltransferase [Planococcus faecalis]